MGKDQEGDDGTDTRTMKGAKAIGVVLVGADKKKKKLDAAYQWVNGDLMSFIRTLTEQLWTGLKGIGANKPEQYARRKKCVVQLLLLYKKTVAYLGHLNDAAAQSEIEALAMAAMH